MRAECSAEFLALRTTAQLREFVEERLYPARGLQRANQPSRPLPDMCPHVRHLPRSEDGISWAQLVAHVADLDHVLSLDDVEPLFLLVVQVPRRSALFDVDSLGDAEAAVCIQGRSLDVDHPGAEHLALAPKPIRPGRDVVSRTSLRAFPCHERSFLDAADPGSL